MFKICFTLVVIRTCGERIIVSSSAESFQEMTVCKGQTVTVNIWPNVSSVEDLIGYPPLDSRGRNLRGQCAYVFSGQDPRPFVIFTYSLSGLRFEIISPSAKFSDKFPWLVTFYSIDKLDSRYISCTVQNGSSKAWKTNFNFIVTGKYQPQEVTHLFSLTYTYTRT